MNTRIYEVRKSLNLTQKQFAENLGMQHSTLSEMERGISNITERTIITICSVYNVNEEWLRSGKRKYV